MMLNDFCFFVFASFIDYSVQSSGHILDTLSDLGALFYTAEFTLAKLNYNNSVMSLPLLGCLHIPLHI